MPASCLRNPSSNHRFTAQPRGRMDNHSQNIARVFTPITRLIDKSAQHRHADAADVAPIQIHRKIGLRQSENIEGSAMVDKLQQYFRAIELLAAKLHAARLVLITVPANIGDDLLNHQLDLLHASDGETCFTHLFACEFDAYL